MPKLTWQPRAVCTLCTLSAPYSMLMWASPDDSLKDLMHPALHKPGWKCHVASGIWCQAALPQAGAGYICAAGYGCIGAAG